MRFIFSNALLLCSMLFALSGPAGAAAGTSKEADPPAAPAVAAPKEADLPAPSAINGPQGHALMSALGERLVVLDVRRPEEVAEGHVPGALLIPLQELGARLGEIPADRPVLILCRTGRRAAIAYEAIRRLRPGIAENGLWYLQATPEYRADGTFIFR